MFLKKKNIPFEMVEHPPVYTIEELYEQQVPNVEWIAKNLFLRDASGKHHFLVMIKGEKTADMKRLSKQIGSTRLSFASEERLMKHMGLKKGSVTPLGVLNNEDRAVWIVVDKDFIGHNIGVHPNENTATVFMPFENLETLIKEHGNTIQYISFDSAENGNKE